MVLVYLFLTCQIYFQGTYICRYNWQVLSTHAAEMQFNPQRDPTTVSSRTVSIETQQCYDLLLGTRSLTTESVRAQECDLLAEYLIRTYEAYKDYHGGRQESQQGLTMLARPPRLGRDILVIRTRLAYDAPLYQLKSRWCSRLSAATAEVMRLLAILYSPNASPSTRERYEQILGSTLIDPNLVFSRHNIVYIDPPQGVNQIHAFTRCFDDLADLEEFVRSVQLWVAFMHPLCSLLATKLKIPGMPRFRASTFKRSQVLILAHNWLMDCIHAPAHMKTPIPGSEHHLKSIPYNLLIEELQS